MAWFKVDDALPANRKVVALPRGLRRFQAIGAWTLAGAWSSANLTEGRIPLEAIEELRIPPRIAADLVTCGLWHEIDHGFQMNDFLDYNPSAERVRKERAAAAERQRRAREKAQAAKEASQATRDSHGVTHAVTTPVTHAVSHGPPDPTRPDPAPKYEHTPATTVGNELLAAHETHGVKLPRKVRQQVGREIDALLAEGVDPDAVWAGLKLLRERPNLGPGLLPNLVHEAATAPRLRAVSGGSRPVIDRSRPDQWWNA